MGALPNALQHGWYYSAAGGLARKHMGGRIYDAGRSRPTSAEVVIYADHLDTSAQYSARLAYSNDGRTWSETSNAITDQQSTGEQTGTVDLTSIWARFWQVEVSVEHSTTANTVGAELSGWLSFRP